MTISEVVIAVHPAKGTTEDAPRVKASIMSNYLLGCVFYMLGSVSFVFGTGFFLADAVSLNKAR